MVDQHEALAFVLRSSSSKKLPKKKKKNFNTAPPFPLRFSLLSFFPKEPLNRSRNPILVWRKSQIFRLQLIDNFGPFNIIIRTFGELQSCRPFKLTFQPNLNHLDWISEPKVMSKILTDVQAKILIWIGLGFCANFLWFLVSVGLKFNWVGLLLNSCLVGCKLT